MLVGISVGVGVDVAVGNGVSVGVGVAVGWAVGVGEGSSATEVAVGAGPHAANNRKLRPMEIPVSSADLIVLCSYVFITLLPQVVERFSARSSWGQADVPPLDPR